MAQYLSTPAVGQIDSTLCWAASLEWWLKAVKHHNVSQARLRDRHSKMWADDGTLSDQSMMNLISNKRYGMTLVRYNIASRFTSDELQQHLDYSPAYIAFTETSSGKKHVNVIYGMSGSGNSATLNVMEPQASSIDDSNGFPTGFYIGQHQTKTLYEFNTFGSVYVGSLMWSI